MQFGRRIIFVSSFPSTCILYLVMLLVAAAAVIDLTLDGPGRPPCDLRVSPCPLASLSIFKAFFGLRQNREFCVSSFDLVPHRTSTFTYTNGGLFWLLTLESHAATRDRHHELRALARGEKEEPLRVDWWLGGGIITLLCRFLLLPL
jgi:hypothetical protein